LVRNWPWQPIFVIEGLTIQLLETPFYAWSCFQTLKKKKKTFQWLHVAKMGGHKAILEKEKSNTKQGVLYTQWPCH
jgi:hypothetical protein